MPKNLTSSTLFADSKRSVFGFPWRRWRNLALVILSFVIPACGGGGGDPPDEVPIPSTSRANLVVDIVTHSECSADRGSLIDISESIRNSGSASASAFRVSLYLSEDRFIETTDIFLAKRDISSLSVGETSSTVVTIQIPAGLNIGTYYVGAIVDDQGSVDEERTDDNTAVSSSCVDGALEVTEPEEPLPDLISQVTNHSPCNIVQGESITVSDSVFNQGAAASGAFRVGIFLSTDSAIEASTDLLLGYRTVNGLSSYETSVGSSTLTVQVTSGTYYIGSVVDYLGDVTEENEQNNILVSSSCGFGHLYVDPPPSSPDLVLDSIWHSPCTVDEGQVISVDVSISNGGSGDAGGFRIGIFRSSDANIDINDHLLGYFNLVSGLVSGASYFDTGSFHMNDGGVFFIGGIVDDLNQVVEESESNNNRLTSSCSGKVTVVPDPGTPDLVITSVSHIACAEELGGSIQVDWTTKSVGSPSGPFEVGIYLSNDTVISPQDVQIGWKSVGALNQGASYSYSSFYDIPSYLSPGTYYVGCVADWANVVTESNESNNGLRSSSCSNGALSVTTPTSDLTMTSVSHSACSVDQGSSITVNSTVRNGGLGNAGQFQVGVYLSLNSTIDTGDLKIGSYTVNSLSSGSSFSDSNVYPVSSNVSPGYHYVGCIADWNAIVAESNETNNDLRSSSCSSGSLTVTIPVREAFLYPTQDMVIASGFPNTNLSGTLWNDYLGLGNDVNTNLPNSDEIWTLIQFDVSNSSLMNAGVPLAYTNSLTDAQLQLMTMGGNNPPYGTTIKLEANDTPWNENTVTWNNYGPGGGTPPYHSPLLSGYMLRFPLLTGSGIWAYWRQQGNNHGLSLGLQFGHPSGLWYAGSSNYPNFLPRIKVTW